jgi:hypothetical protein
MVLAMTVAIGVAASAANAQLIGYWPLDETSGTIANEMIHGIEIDGINLDGYFQGLPVWDPTGGRILSGKQTGAIYLHPNDRIVCGYVPGSGETSQILDFDRQPMTLAFWAKTDGPGWPRSFAHIVGKGYSYRIYANSTFSDTRWRTNYGGILNCETNVSDGEWHHHVGTYDGKRDFLYYIDGVVKGTYTNNQDRGPYNTSYPFTIGQNWYYDGRISSTNYSNIEGWIDDVCVWGIVLNKKQILDLMEKGALGVNIPPVVEAGPPQISHLPQDLSEAEIRLIGSVTDQTVFGANVLTWHWDEATNFGTLSFYAQNGITPSNTDLNGVVKTYDSHIYEVVLTASDGELEANDVFMLDVRLWDWTGEVVRYRFENDLEDTAPALSSEINDRLTAYRHIGIREDNDRPEKIIVGTFALTFEPGIDGQAIRLRDVNMNEPDVDWLYNQPAKSGTQLQAATSFETALHGFGTWTIDGFIRPELGMTVLSRFIYTSQVDYDRGWLTSGTADDGNTDMWYTVIDGDPGRYEFGGNFWMSNGNLVGMRYAASARGMAEAWTPPGEWHHVGVTADAFYITTWVNGHEIETRPYDGTVAIKLDADDGMRISSIFYDRSFEGLIDDIRINLEPKGADYFRTQARRLPLELKHPEHNYQFATTDTVLKWAPGKGPFNFVYEVWLSKSSETIVKVATITDGSTTYAPDSLLPNTEYKWEIHPIADGTPTANSPRFKFRTLPVGFEGMIGHWTFDEGTGKIVNDTATGLNRSGVDWNYAGTIIGNGNPKFVPGWMKADRKFAGNFSGEGGELMNYVVVKEPNALAEFGAPDYIAGFQNSDPCIFRELPYNNFTLSLWMKSTVGFQAIDETFLSFGNSYNLRRYYYSDYATFGFGGIGNLDGGQYVIGDGNWHHVAGVYDKENELVLLYVDGQLDSSAEFDYLDEQDIPSIDRSSASQLRIASNYLYTPRNFHGAIDDVRIYSYLALDASEIQDLYNMGYAHKRPAVDAGDNQVITGTSTTLSGIVSNDNLPPAATYTVTWSKVSGPSATITPTNNVNTTVSNLVPGVYTFRLTVNDNAYNPFDDVKVWVQATADDNQMLLWHRFESDLNGDPAVLEVANELATGNNYMQTPLQSVLDNVELEDANYVALLDPNVPVNPLPWGPTPNNYSLGKPLDTLRITGTTEVYPELQFAESITVEFFTEIANEGNIELIDFLGEVSVTEDRTMGSGFRFYNPRALRVQYYIEGEIPGTSRMIEIRTTANLSDYTTGSGVNVLYHVQGWKHVAWTYDKATGTSRVFENGVPVYITHVTEQLPAGATAVARPGDFFYDGIDGRGLVMPPSIDLDSDPEVIIFMDGVDGANGANFDEVRISAKVLTPSEFLIVGENHCLGALAADIDGNCQVDLYDYVILALNWMKNTDPYK